MGRIHHFFSDGVLARFPAVSAALPVLAGTRGSRSSWGCCRRRSRPTTTWPPGRRWCGCWATARAPTGPEGLRVLVLGSGATPREIALTALGRNHELEELVADFAGRLLRRLAGRAARHDVGRRMSELPRTPADLAAQLQAAAERLTKGWTGTPPPATLTTQQLQAVLDDLAAHRAQVQALQTQLGLFDDQLAALETALTPLREWTAAWSGFERAAIDMWRPPR